MDVIVTWITIQMDPKTHREMDDRRPTAQNLIQRYNERGRQKIKGKRALF